jgi:flagellar hook-basal body complex protein FliE
MKVGGIDNLSPETCRHLTLEPAISNHEKSAAINFTDWLTENLSNTNTNLLHADVALQNLAQGKTNNLHQTMLQLEEAKLSFQFLEQIRNRLMNAYQDILKEQI